MTMTSNMMKVLHTPLLRPTCTPSSTAGNNICTNSGAGVYINNNNGEDIIGIESRVYRPDMRKLVANHGSPKFTINIDKTPTVVGGKKEHFGSISDMIVIEGGRRRKRLSKSIRELSGRFEKRGDGHDSQLGV
jgi:hypothetical protein